MIRFTLILSTLLFAALQSSAGEIKIIANLDGFSDNAVAYLLNGQTPLAYQTISQGTVELKAEVPESPETYVLYVVENNQPYYTMLFVADETIEVTATKKDFPYAVKVTGSEYHPAKATLDEMQAPIHKKSETLKQEIVALQQNGEWQKPEVREKYVGENGLTHKITEELKQLEAEFILNHLDTAYAFSLLQYNTTAFDSTFYQAVYNKMTPKQQQSETGQQYLLASKSKRLTKGNQYIDFNVLDKNLNTQKLSDYFNRNKAYVLVDLSSVSCPSSNQAFSITKNFSEKNKEKLEVVTVLQSPDANTYKQFGALSTENWSLVYAENFMNSDAYIKYQENATPTFLLFDKNGKLVDRWTGSLIHQQKLEEHFGK